MSWLDIQFANVGVLWGGVAFLIILFIAAMTKKLKFALPSWLLTSVSRRYYRHPNFELVYEASNKKVTSSKSSKQWAVFIFYAVLSALIMLSLAHPYRIGNKLPEAPQHRDIMFIVDTSINMVLRDYAVNGQRVQRMTMMKDVLSHFISKLQGNRMGVIAFSEQAYTLVPLTTDYGLLNTQVQRLDTDTLTGRTNDLSHDLLYTYKQLSSDRELTEGEAAPAVVLLTSVNRPSRNLDPRAVARFYQQRGFSLHTVAIGAPDYAAKEKDTMSLIYHPANFELLEQLASEAGGLFFWAKNTESLQHAIETILQASPRKAEQQVRYIEIPLYHWPLLLALAWAVLWKLVPLVVTPLMLNREST
jgi:Ca-activated chloride channel family protein